MKISIQLKALSVSLMTFFAFIIVVTRIGFLMNVPINRFTLWFALCVFVASALLIFKTQAIKTIVLFLGVLVLLGLSAYFLSKTYDTSWDGQGYHQSAVIALKNGWNPIYESDIHFEQRLPSQIFAESYPSAVWEVQATIYAISNSINSAKVINLAVSMVAFLVVYVLLRKMTLGKITSIAITLLVVIQPLFIIQFLSFMQDGFGYQLIVVAIASLLYFILDKNSIWAITMFILSEIYLASAKYSHLPMVLMLGIICMFIVINRFLNKDYVLSKNLAAAGVGLMLFSIIFAYLPYGRNALFHHAVFYPTNITELSGSVTYNNLPHNLENRYKITQLFYGLFSASQSYQSSDNRSETNVASLKIPFTFSETELSDSAKLYNNRAGAQGPLYSGILVISLLFCIGLSFKAQTQSEKYVFYGIYFIVGFIVVTSLFVPTPNLIRYTSQTQLLPFVLFVPMLVLFQKRPVQVIGIVLILLLLVNNALYAAAVIAKTVDEEQHIETQFEQMRSSGNTYQVRAQQFYSSYVLLNEQHISFMMVDRLHCGEVERLYASSTTTEFCTVPKH